MAVQFDFSSGLDLSGLTSVSQAQLMQAINQLAPLSNIGGVLYGTAAQFDAAFIADNPRCIRYILLDTSTTPPTPKYWDISGTPAWEPVTVADASVTAAKLAAHTNAPALNHFFDGVTPVAGNASKVLAYDGSGQYITQLTRASFMSGYLLPITQLDPTGVSTAKRYVRYDGSNFAYAAIEPNADIAAGALALTKIAPGASLSLLRTNIAGTGIEAVSNDDFTSDFLIAGSVSTGVRISKLKFTGVPYAQLRHNSAGTALEYAKDPEMYSIVYDLAAVADGNVALDLGLHGLSSDVVDIIDIKLVWNGSYYGYVLNDVTSADIVRMQTADPFDLPAFYGYVKGGKLYVAKKGGAANMLVIGNDGTLTSALNFSTIRAYFDLRATVVRFNR